MSCETIQKTERVIALLTIVAHEAKMLAEDVETGDVRYNRELAPLLDALVNKLNDAKKVANP